MAPFRRDAGTSSIVHETTLLFTHTAIVETIVHLRAARHKVVLVSSGAIGVRLQRKSMPARPKSLLEKQKVSLLTIPSDLTAYC